MSRVMIWLCLPVLWPLAGCMDSATMEAEQQRVIRDAEPEEVLTAAAAVLQREFGRVKVDRAAGRITTGPVEFSTERESGTARDLYRGRSTMRRIAQFGVARSGGQTVARLRVDVERRDTERQAVMRPRTYRLTDNPGQETPVDDDAATTAEQNSVWTRVRRDRTLERAILDELREQFARLSTTPENAEAVEPSAGKP